jgi:CheY-like chemotaxis protein
VLVVDDSAMSRKMLLKTLKANGHTCEEAEDGKQAVEKVKADLDKFHVILMDFVMPVMDGPDATKAIRDLGYTRPIIGCTGNTLEMDLKRFRDSGCKYVIGKPFENALFYTYMSDHEAAESGRSNGSDAPDVVPVSASADASPRHRHATMSVLANAAHIATRWRSSGKGVSPSPLMNDAGTGMLVSAVPSRCVTPAGSADHGVVRSGERRPHASSPGPPEVAVSGVPSRNVSGLEARDSEDVLAAAGAGPAGKTSP